MRNLKYSMENNHIIKSTKCYLRISNGDFLNSPCVLYQDYFCFLKFKTQSRFNQWLLWWNRLFSENFEFMWMREIKSFFNKFFDLFHFSKDWLNRVLTVEETMCTTIPQLPDWCWRYEQFRWRHIILSWQNSLINESFDDAILMYRPRIDSSGKEFERELKSGVEYLFCSGTKEQNSEMKTKSAPMQIGIWETHCDAPRE
jgi:hypothetical protein